MKKLIVAITKEKLHHCNCGLYCLQAVRDKYNSHHKHGSKLTPASLAITITGSIILQVKWPIGNDFYVMRKSSPVLKLK